MANLPIVLSVEGEGAVKAALGRVKNDARKMGGALGGATSRAESGFKRAQKSAQKFGAKFKDAASSPGVLAGGAASVGLRMLSSNLIQAGDEAEGAALKLEGMLAKRGQSFALNDIKALGTEMSKISGIDDDEISNVAAGMLGFGINAKQIRSIMPGLIGQARLYDQSLSSVAMAFGKSFSEGNIGKLKKSGITLDDDAQDKIDAIGKSYGKAAKQAALLAMVQKSMDEFALGAAGGQSEAQLTRKYASVQFGNVMEEIGKGAGKARAGWQGNLTPLAERVQQSPGALAAIGAGAEAASVLAPLMTGMAVLGQSLPAFTLFSGGVKKIGPLLTTARNATNLHTLATVFNGNAMAAGALKMKAATLAMGPMGMLGALGLLAISALAVNDIMQSAKDATLGDEAYEKKRGERGKWENKKGKGLASWWDRVSGKDAQGQSLDAQIAAQNAANKKKFSGRKSDEGGGVLSGKSKMSGVAKIMAGVVAPKGKTTSAKAQSATVAAAARKAEADAIKSRREAMLSGIKAQAILDSARTAPGAAGAEQRKKIAGYARRATAETRANAELDLGRVKSRTTSRGQQATVRVLIPAGPDVRGVRAY